MKPIYALLPLIVSATLASAPARTAGTEPAPPEVGFGREAKAAVEAREFMVAAAHPVAAQAGYDVLARGGTAMDAAVAVQMVLNLVEPQSSGLGGGAFLLYYDAGEDRLRTFDGRETAPMGIEPDRFLGADGEPLPWWERITGGGSVGVPGTLRLLEAAHQRFGREPFERLLEPAMALARDGFEVSPRMANSIADAADRGLKRFESTRAYFFDENGEPLAAGTRLANPAFADTLALVAKHGSGVFYEGEIARDIVDTVNASRSGSMSLEDLAAYDVIERPAVCAPFRAYRVCGMGPPTSGGLTIGQILGMVAAGPRVESFDAASVHRIVEAEKLAYADRGMYMADSDFEPVPIAGLLDPAYLASRAALIEPGKAMAEATAGEPPVIGSALRLAPDRHEELAGTSHISIIDRYGNALSMTTTIESGFGSRLMVRGFLLNNELTDFSPVSEVEGRAVANRIEPGKRPRSSMAPTVVFDADGKPVLVVGSPGGSRIINYVASVIIAVLDAGMDIQAAVSRPHFGNRNGPTELEENTPATKLRGALEALGHEIRVGDMNSGLHAILIGPDGTLRGGADPRREGVALGE